jgi:orotate phosphoribosyltransferase/uridine monophosphate synthetase
VLGTDETNLWLARALFDVGGIAFGDFTLGRTAVNSPVYVNPRLLIGEPAILRRVARLIENEVKAGQARRRPRISPFSLVAGVPFGGLHLATAFSLATDVPMVYPRQLGDGPRSHTIEGVYRPGQQVLIIDDLITGGGSILETAQQLEEAGLVVRDAIVLVDRQQGGAERLRLRGYNLISILRLKTVLNYYHETGLIESTWYDRSMVYLEGQQGEPPA